MLSPNTILQNRYRIHSLLGQGGMGAVYLAHDARLNQTVALKENTGATPRQFHQEAQILARLRHNNLPRVIDHFVEPNGAQYLVMDYIEGEDLETLRQRRGALPEIQVRAWFDQILDAVAYLHGQGVIHRDIKPGNIKITPGDQVALVDFGIAKVYQPGQLTPSSQKFGSPGYASPEHYKGGTNQQSDIYSLGATLYAVLTGGAPPDAQSLERGTAILVPPRNINPAISPQMEQVVLRAMRVQPYPLFSSVVEMRQNLFALAPTIPVSVPKSRNNTRLIAALGVAIVGVFMLCGVGGWILVDNNQTPTPRPASAIALVTQSPSITPSLSATPTPVTTQTLYFTPTSATTLTAYFTLTPTPTPSATFTRLPAPTSTTAPTRTLTATPSQFPTAVPTIRPVAPGVYVTEIIITPAEPKSRERFRFNVKFLNTTSKMQTVLWRILIWRENGGMVGIAMENGHDVFAGESNLISQTFDINVKGCEKFFAEARDDTSFKFARIPNTDGNVFQLMFQVCP